MKNQVCMPINGRVRCIDYCIHHIVAALNAANISTAISCCGHGKHDGVITLEDGRALVIMDADDQRVWHSGEQIRQPSTLE